MAPAMATKRLREELIKLKTEPPPGIVAEPDESNILKWFYVIRGPSDTAYEGGIYIGKLVFPSEYPMKAPSIHMLTPSGRFQINTKICMSMSDFHPESWNPMWSVSTIIQGVQSFMASEELTTGGLKASEADRKKFAKLSSSYNQKNYPNLFDGDIEAALEAANVAYQKAQDKNAKSTDQTPASTRRSRRAAKKAGSTEAEKSQETADGTSSGKDPKPSLSRRGRRLAKKASSTEPDQANEDTEQLNNQSDDESNHEDDQNSPADASATNETKELSAAEIEKRRKRNAKKRAKQKAKKSAASTPE